jgi:NAD(P)H-dependent flavin oxidoreductase YrpB (nitropropane dioxygenase family)
MRMPVIGAPLFIISNPDLVIAQCKAGVVGSFPPLVNEIVPAAALVSISERISRPPGTPGVRFRRPCAGGVMMPIAPLALASLG